MTLCACIRENHHLALTLLFVWAQRHEHITHNLYRDQTTPHRHVGDYMF
jgi:hypothetical protein